MRLLALLFSLLVGCGQTPSRPAPGKLPPPSAVGAYYKDDGPIAGTPDNLDAITDPDPRWEPINKGAARPYVIFGRTYTPNTALKTFKQRGIASWYGKKFHGSQTSIGETYDMFALSAAHTTLALPSYLRVSNPANGKQVIVRVNDRGPFHPDRIIDLSYTAAFKLGLVGKGSGEVEIEAIIPDAPLDTTYAEIGPDKKEVLQNSSASAAAAPDSGFFIQLGAFSQKDNAANLRVHALKQLEWLTEPVRVFSENDLHRVQIGPFVSRSEADIAVSRILKELGSKPSIVIR